MRLNVYIFKNAFLGCSGNPIFDDHEPDVFSKSIERMLITSSAEKAASYENVTLYHIAVYDDESLRFEPVKDPVMILDCNVVLEDRKVKAEILSKLKEQLEKKEVSSDGKE